MTRLLHLNQKYAITGQVTFSPSPAGAIIADVDNDFSQAQISISGGHLLSWQPKNQEHPVIWLSKQANIARGKSIRGGIPICWPWFGAHSHFADFPSHGYARTADWNVVETATLANGENRIKLTLESDKQYQRYWPYTTPLTLTITVGQRLNISLNTQNNATNTIIISEALHSYFHISDIGDINITGLEGCDYLDKTENFNRKTQLSSLSFNSETDRVYVNTHGACVIHDPKLQRRIHVTKSASASTVVWTPWEDKARAMGDLGDNAGWRQMICVESANVLENAVSIPPSGDHTLAVEYWAE